VPPNRHSAPEVVLDIIALAEQSFATWMEIERHLKDAEKQMGAIRALVGEFQLPRSAAPLSKEHASAERRCLPERATGMHTDPSPIRASSAELVRLEDDSAVTS
jgi:hypothetical protein